MYGTHQAPFSSQLRHARLHKGWGGLNLARKMLAKGPHWFTSAVFSWRKTSGCFDHTLDIYLASASWCSMRGGCCAGMTHLCQMGVGFHKGWLGITM